MADELHYLTYDADAIWQKMQEAYIAAGGDVLYPGDPKEMLLRSVQAMFMQAFAGIDNALLMRTRKYAVREYLDLVGENSFCPRIQAEKATLDITVTLDAASATDVIPSGSMVTADGEALYEFMADAERPAGSDVIRATVTCTQAGRGGNGVTAGTSMQFVVPVNGVISVVAAENASGGQDAEDDEAYRARIALNGASVVTTGTKERYEAAALAVSSEIIQANAMQDGAGRVKVALILKDGASSAAIVSAVEEALSPSDERPLTDSVSVAVASEKEYEITVKYRLPSGVTDTSALEAAIEDYHEWQDYCCGREFNPDQLISRIYQAGAMRAEIDSGSTFDGGACEYTEVAADERCTGNVTLAPMT